MHSISPIVALSGFFIANTMAAPFHPQLSSFAIPNPNSTTYEADLAAVVAYARSHTAPVAAIDTTTAAPVKMCGIYTSMTNNPGRLTYTSEVCQDTVEFEHMEYFYNWYRELCIVFDGPACGGTIRWTGTRTHRGFDDGHRVHDAQSYFCN